jgi:excisionase family DNA binding protein
MANAITKPQSEAVVNSPKYAAGLNNAAIYSKEQAAQILGCTVRYIERQIRGGRLRACKPSGNFVRIFGKDVTAFLESGATIGGT